MEQLPRPVRSKKGSNWQLRMVGPSLEVVNLINSGLSLAWELGYRHAEVESDSSEGVNLIHQDSSCCAPLALVHCIKWLSDLTWSVSFLHSSRNNNNVVDALAKLANTENFDLVSFVLPLVSVVRLLQEDNLLYVG
ncbi:hypothetical protein V6N13_109809 [Hibiscus sabdariffa]